MIALSRRTWEKNTMLEVHDISVRYTMIPVLHEVSFKVQEGQTVAIVGANGAGKSTILKTISGLLHPFSGTIEFMSEKIHQLPPFTITTRGISHVPEGRSRNLRWSRSASPGRIPSEGRQMGNVG